MKMWKRRRGAETLNFYNVSNGQIWKRRQSDETFGSTGIIILLLPIKIKNTLNYVNPLELKRKAKKVASWKRVLKLSN